MESYARRVSNGEMSETRLVFYGVLPYLFYGVLPYLLGLSLVRC